jgi:hypothetical protein
VERFLAKLRASGVKDIVITDQEGEEHRILLVEFRPREWEGEWIAIRDIDNKYEWSGACRAAKKLKERVSDPRDSLPDWITLMRSLAEYAMGVLVEADRQRGEVFALLVEENKSLRELIRAEGGGKGGLAAIGPAATQELVPMLRELLGFRETVSSGPDIEKLKQVLSKHLPDYNLGWLDRASEKSEIELAADLYTHLGNIAKHHAGLLAGLSAEEQIFLRGVYQWMEQKQKENKCT